MSISNVSSAAAEATSLTMPSHQAGDLLVMLAFNNGSATIPTLPSGWILAQNRSANVRGSVLAFKIASNAAEVSGTWTNASFVAVAVYRDSVNYLTLGGPLVTGSGASTTPQFLAAPSRSGGSWFLGAIGVNLNTQAVETPPTGMTNRVNLAGASAGEVSLHDTNGLTTWPLTSVSLLSAVIYQSYVAEIVDTGVSKVSGGLIVPRNFNGGYNA